MNLKDKMKLQILFRGGFVLTMATSAAVLHLFYSDPISEVLLYLLGVGILFSGASLLSLRWMSESWLSSMAWTQLFGDLLYFSLLVYFTGGVSSAFSAIFSLQIISGAVVIGSRGAFAATAGAIVLFVTVSLLKLQGLPQSPETWARLILISSVLLLVGSLVAWLTSSREGLAEKLQRTQDDLRDLNQLHSTILAHIPSGILYLDESSRIRFINPAGERILGRECLNRDLIGTTYEVLLGRDQRFESKMKLPQGERMIGHYRTSLPEGGSVVVFQDVTDIRDLEKRMSLNEKLAGIGQLAAGIAHEIRNPLASLSGSIQLLQSELKLDAESQRLFHIVLRETDRLDHLANNFLTYAKPSDLNLQRVEIKKILDDVSNLLKHSPDFQDRGVSLKFDIAENLWCVCDARQLKQILWNLMLNAVQASSKSGWIQVKATETSGARVRFVVEDSGEGMDEEIQKKIFDPFFTTKAQGSGLGLALVYQMVANHGGNIGVESVKGKGSRFWFELYRDGPLSQPRSSQVAGMVA